MPGQRGSLLRQYPQSVGERLLKALRFVEKQATAGPFPVHGFQIACLPVIVLDLTDIIAFDAVRDCDCCERILCDAAFRKWAGMPTLLPHGKKTGQVPEQQQKRVCGL